MMKRSLLASLFVLFPVLIFGQMKQDTKVNMSKALTQPTKIQSIVGLLGLDPNRFSMSHSYSLSVGSFGGNSYNQGLYLNTMRYQISNPLSAFVQLGFSHQPFRQQNSQFGQQDQFFVSGAGLKYKPSENFQVQFEFSQRPNSYYSPYNYYNQNRFNRTNSLFEKTENENN